MRAGPGSFPKTPLHLVSGESATGCVRAACAAYGLPGDVVGFSDDLASGPLVDGVERVDYVRAALMAYGEGTADPYVPFWEWRLVFRHLQENTHDALVVWTGDNAADAVFLAMACDRVSQRPEPVWRVVVPGNGVLPYVAAHSPEQLAVLYARREVLSEPERGLLARDFKRIRDTCGPVRRLEGGRIVAAPEDCFDHLLLSACHKDWQRATFIVGQAMAGCDWRNLMGDAFFAGRLRTLVEAGCIEATGPQVAFRDCAVRLPTR